MQESTLNETFSQFSGLDYRSHDKSRDPRYARDANNVLPLNNNSLSVRPGHKGRARSAGGGGVHPFVYRQDGDRYEELLTIDDKLHRLVQGSFTATYAGTGTAATFEIKPVDNGDGTYTFHCIVMEDDTGLLDQDLGVGLDEAAVVDVAALIAAINALAPTVTCTLTTGVDTGPAAFIANQQTVVAAAPGTVIEFEYWEEVPCPLAAPFSAFWANKYLSTFQNASFLTIGDRALIATGGELYKYDSVATYRAGLPEDTLSAAAGAAGNPNGTYYYGITYEHTDELGHITEGDMGVWEEIALVNQKGTLTVPNLIATSGFQTACAIVAGAQAGVNQITVDDGAGGTHTMYEGLTAYFYDGVTGDYVEREITTADATTITVAGAAVNVADNAVISANLRINIWRNQAGSTIQQLVASIPNDSFNATTTYTDDVADASLGAEYEEPIEGHGVPPAGLKYLTAFGGLVIGCDGSDSVFFSDYDGPEYWNSDLSVQSKSSEPVTGCGANREVLLIFKPNEVHVIRGSLPDARYTQEIHTDAVGCDSHHSIVDVEGSLWFLSAIHGVKRLVASELAQSVGYRIDSILSAVRTDSAEQFQASRVQAVNLPAQKLVVFFVPAETDNGSERYANANSTVLYADYSTQWQLDAERDSDGNVLQTFPAVKWWRGDSMNMSGGACLYQNRLVWGERRYGATVTAVEMILTGALENNSEYDFCDHGQPIEWSYYAGWIDMGAGELLKKFLRMQLYSFPELSASFTVHAGIDAGWINDLARTERDLSFGAESVSSGWATWGFGTPGWGDAADTRKLFEFMPLPTEAIGPVFTATVFCEQPVLSGWTIEAVPAYEKHIKKVYA